MLWSKGFASICVNILFELILFILQSRPTVASLCVIAIKFYLEIVTIGLVTCLRPCWEGNHACCHLHVSSVCGPFSAIYREVSVEIGRLQSSRGSTLQCNVMLSSEDQTHQRENREFICCTVFRKLAYKLKDHNCMPKIKDSSKKIVFLKWRNQLLNSHDIIVTKKAQKYFFYWKTIKHNLSYKQIFLVRILKNSTMPKTTKKLC